jgi:hybrid cluster-associated redox disulfide protein
VNVNRADASQNANVAVVAGAKMEERKITKKTKLSEILSAKSDAVEILFEAGMGCIGCPMAQSESLEDGCKAHGMSDKAIDELVKKLNKIKKK